MTTSSLQADTGSSFGQSLHLDFYGVSKVLCNEIDFFYDLLDGLVDLLKMNKQAPPFIFRSPEAAYPDKAGLSGWVPLIESGISVHTLTVTGFVSIDVYTCGPLDISGAVDFLVHQLGTSDCEQQHLVRGTRYHGR